MHCSLAGAMRGPHKEAGRQAAAPACRLPQPVLPLPGPARVQPRGADRWARNEVGNPYGVRLLLAGAACVGAVQGVREKTGGHRG